MLRSVKLTECTKAFLKHKATFEQFSLAPALLTTIISLMHFILAQSTSITYAAIPCIKNCTWQAIAVASQPELILELEHFIFSKDFPVAEREGGKGKAL